MSAELPPDIHERSVFELDNWHILRPRTHPGSDDELIRAVHVNCVRFHDGDLGTSQTVKWTCYRCRQPVPDEIQGLMVMLDWERRDE